MRNTESDAFGPWITEIDSEALLPKLYAGVVDMAKNYDVLVKIPRDIERRKVVPGMDLYDYVLGVYDNELLIYKRVGSSVTQDSIKLEDIVSIEEICSILLGRLVIKTYHSKFEFEFSTVSLTVVTKLISIIRKYTNRNYADISLQLLPDTSIKSLDIFFTNKVNQMKYEEEKLHVLALQPSINLSYEEYSNFKKAYLRIMNGHLQSCLYLTNFSELIVLKYGKNFARINDSDYSFSITYIPFDKITTPILTDSPQTSELDIISIGKDDNIVDFIFTDVNEHKDSLFRNLQIISNSI